jgi:hypothetical protein
MRTRWAARVAQFAKQQSESPDMDPKTKTLGGTYAAVIIALATMLLSGCNRPATTSITGIRLRDIPAAGDTFHGYYVVDGVTNRVQGSMPTNFPCAEKSLVFEFVRDQKTPLGLELTVSRSDGMDRTAHSQYGIRGHMYLNSSGSDEWLSEPFKN